MVNYVSEQTATYKKRSDLSAVDDMVVAAISMVSMVVVFGWLFLMMNVDRSNTK